MPYMRPLLLSDIEAAVRSSWDAETCTPDYRSRWSPENPARDQCGVTAMVLNDLLGGDLIRGAVHVDGVRVDYHWWNCLGQGVEIDLTREQFGPRRSSSVARSSTGRRHLVDCALSTSFSAAGCCSDLARSAPERLTAPGVTAAAASWSLMAPMFRREQGALVLPARLPEVISSRRGSTPARSRAGVQGTLSRLAPPPSIWLPSRAP
jgi:hypothetical protein